VVGARLDSTQEAGASTVELKLKLILHAPALSSVHTAAHAAISLRAARDSMTRDLMFTLDTREHEYNGTTALRRSTRWTTLDARAGHRVNASRT